MKIRNLIAALKCQLPLKRAFRNFFITGNAWGIFSINSHIRQSNGQPKIAYGTYASAMKAAEQMTRKTGMLFNAYKCVFCDSYHIGKTRNTQHAAVSAQTLR